MKNRFFFYGSFFALMLLFTACTTVRFRQPQPSDASEMEAFPDKITGIYLNENQDTLKISNESFTYGNEKTNLFYYSQKLISDSIVLKKWKSYYVLNLKTENYWEVFLFKEGKNIIRVYYITFEEEDNDFIEKLRNILPVEEVRQENGELEYLLIDPSPKQFNALKKHGFFREIESFTRIE
ncbi:MAG TPA: hypothetical protein PLI65_02555 [Bacteroidales bacterium]|nr:hypothetical protein [Bacteroidales bacterium]HPR57672.1 hypothetical protein [Bacteroidales bacterium]